MITGPITINLAVILNNKDDNKLDLWTWYEPLKYKTAECTATKTINISNNFLHNSILYHLTIF